MIETFVKVRWNITFIEEEIPKIDGSEKIKKKILNICAAISSVLGKIGEWKDAEIIAGIKKELSRFDDIIGKIEGDDENGDLYMLLITHVADMHFLFLSKEEQKSVLDAIKK